MLSYPSNRQRVVIYRGRHKMKLQLKIIVFTMIAFLPISTHAGTNSDLQRALVFKQHGLYGKAFPIFLKLAEIDFVRAQMEISDLYFMGHGILKNDDQAVYWACRAAKSGEIRALKFRIRLALKTTSDNYQPRRCEEVIK